MNEPPEPLSLSTKLAYGAGDLGPAITSNLLVFFLLPFLTNVVGLSAGVAGSILAISKVWDALIDPAVGILTDRTKSRWGRRRPWLLFGAVPFGVAFFAQWLVPFAGNPGASFWYYLCVAIVFNTLFTAVNLPYTALTPELTEDYDERTSLSNYRFAFSIGGSLVSGVAHPLIVGQFPGNPALGYLVSGGVWAVLSVLPLFWCFLGTRERYQAGEPSAMPIQAQLSVAFANRPYLFVVGIYLCSWLAVQLTATIVPYYVGFWMGLSEVWLARTILAIQGTAFVMLFVWSALSVRIGKKAVYFLGMGALITAQVGLLLLQPGQTTAMILLCVLAGMGVSTAYLIPWSMLPDVIDLDELETGERREGVFYALLVLLQKVCLAGSLLLVGQVLDASGFISASEAVPNPTQPESALFALRLIIGPIPAVALLFGLLFARWYPITKARHQEILAALAARREAKAS